MLSSDIDDENDPDELTLNHPQELDSMVDEVEQELGRIAKKGGSSCLQQYVQEEMQELEIDIADGCFSGVTIAELKSSRPPQQLGIRKKRRYEKMSIAEAADSINPRVKRLEELTRVTFLASLDPETCASLVLRVFPEYMNEPSDAWVGRLALRRVRQNCTQWKSRTIKAMQSYVLQSFNHKDVGMELRDDYLKAQRLRRIYTELFSIEEFETVFHFTADYIDLRQSTEKGKWWANMVFTNLAAYVKMVIDVEQGRSKASDEQKKRLNQKELLKAFNNIGKQNTMAAFCPDISDFWWDINTVTKKKKKAIEAEVYDPNEDDLLGVPAPPPGVDRRKLPVDSLDDWRAAESTCQTFNKKVNPKSNAKISSL